MSDSISAEPMPPIGTPIIVDERGYAWVPSRTSGEVNGWYLRPGLSLAWAPLPGNTGAFLHMLAGVEPEPGYEDDGLAITLTRPGLQRLIADLQSIARQLAAPGVDVPNSTNGTPAAVTAGVPQHQEPTSHA